MANVEAPDFYADTQATFEAAYADLLVALKRNYDSAGNLAGALDHSLAQRYTTAEWANLIDDFVIATRPRVRWLQHGSGSPEGVVTAPVGTLYVRDDGGAGTTLYAKETGTGNTGWVTISSASSAGNGSARSLLGRASNSSGARADIQGTGTSTAPAVPVDNGTTLAFRELTILDVNHTLLETDFTQETNRTFSDGANTIGGLSHTVTGTTSLQNFESIAGQGIYMAADVSISASTFTSASQAAPHFYLPLSSIPGFDPRWCLQVEIYCSSLVHEANGEGVFVGLWGPAAAPVSTSASRVRTAGLYNNTGVRNIRGVSQTTVTNGDAGIATHNVVGFRLTHYGHGVALSGVWSSGWPASLDAGLAFPTAVGATDPLICGASRLVIGLSVASDASPTTAVMIARRRIRRVG